MTEVSQQAADFLKNVFDMSGLHLRVGVKQGIAGEVLEALQHLINQVYGRSLESGARLVCDVNGFRATREAELQAMANHAANRVRQTGMPFTFEPMSANERRIIHLTLAESADLSTESVGEGADRKLKISPKSSARKDS
jgi:spoIIIJ-associated protein